MPDPSPRVMAFVDHSNLFEAAEREYGVHQVGRHHYDSFAVALSKFVEEKGWCFVGGSMDYIHIYAPDKKGPTDKNDNRVLPGYRKLRRQQGINVHMGELEFLDEKCRADAQKPGNATFFPCRHLKQEYRERQTEVNLATDLISYHQDYDIAILVSRDPDFIPAVLCAQKAKNKKVVNMFFYPTRLADVCAEFEDLRAVAPGIFGARTYSPPPNKGEVFLVHGRDITARDRVNKFLERLSYKPIILEKESDSEWTVMAKFEQAASNVVFAIIIATPDDLGHLKSEPQTPSLRLRQNVIFEFGYFAAKLGPGRVAVLRFRDSAGDEAEFPSDYGAGLYLRVDEDDDWQDRLAQKLERVTKKQLTFS